MIGKCGRYVLNKTVRGARPYFTSAPFVVESQPPILLATCANSSPRMDNFKLNFSGVPIRLTGRTVGLPWKASSFGANLHNGPGRHGGLANLGCMP